MTADDENLDMAGQTRKVLTKIDQYLAVAGTDNSKLVSATIFLTDLSQKPHMDTVWKALLAPTIFLPWRLSASPIWGVMR